MNPEAILSRVLAERGSAPSTAGNDVVLANGTRIHANVTKQAEQPGGHTVMMVFEATHEQLAQGMQDFAVAAGATPEQAIERACATWADGTLPVLNAAAQENPSLPGVDVLDMAKVNADDDSVQGWEIFLGPMQAGFGQTDAELEQVAKDVLRESMIAMVMETDALSERRPHWLRCSITRQPGGQATGECWLDNNPWELGSLGLDAAAKEFAKFEPRATTMQVFRQFVLCRPTDRVSPQAEAAARAQLAAGGRGRSSARLWIGLAAIIVIILAPLLAVLLSGR